MLVLKSAIYGSDTYELEEVTRKNREVKNYSKKEVVEILKSGKLIIGLTACKGKVFFDYDFVYYDDYKIPEERVYSVQYSYTDEETYLVVYTSGNMELFNIDTEKRDYFIDGFMYANILSMYIEDDDLVVSYDFGESCSDYEFCVIYHLLGKGKFKLNEKILAIEHNDGYEIEVDVPLEVDEAEEMLRDLGIEDVDIDEDEPYKLTHDNLYMQFNYDLTQYLVSKTSIMTYGYQIPFKTIYRKE
jgi:hypothetical protein